MKKKLLSLLLFSLCTTGFCTTWTITNSGFEFSPDDITIQVGDSVNFSIATIHNVVEVSQATWEANGNTPLPGFSTPFGGGMVLPDQLTAGIHYYVCSPHASGGMKGIIVVENTSGIPINPLTSIVSVYPNPTKGKFQLKITDSQFANNFNLEIYDVRGERVYVASNLKQQTLINFDLSDFPKGMYFVKLNDGAYIYNKKVVVQ